MTNGLSYTCFIMMQLNPFVPESPHSQRWVKLIPFLFADYITRINFRTEKGIFSSY